MWARAGPGAAPCSPWRATTVVDGYVGLNVYGLIRTTPRAWSWRARPPPAAQATTVSVTSARRRVGDDWSRSSMVRTGGGGGGRLRGGPAGGGGAGCFPPPPPPSFQGGGGGGGRRGARGRGGAGPGAGGSWTSAHTRRADVVELGSLTVHVFFPCPRPASSRPGVTRRNTTPNDNPTRRQHGARLLQRRCSTWPSWRGVRARSCEAARTAAKRLGVNLREFLERSSS
jgi:hypothetical protein